ncbi:MAG TPA: ArdC family protein [Friedmanniella sp.]
MAGRRTPEQRASAREADLAAVQDRLTRAVEALVSGDDWIRALRFAARFRTRSFANTLLIWTQHTAAYQAGLVDAPEPSYVAGYGQWQMLGRHIVAGQHGYVIRAPSTVHEASATPDDPTSWRRLRRGERPRPGETQRHRTTGFVPVRVFDVSQTGGAPIPQRPEPQLLAGQAPAGLSEGLDAQITRAGFTLRAAAGAGELGGANGLTDFAAREVRWRSDMDPVAQVKTKTHELAHITMHGPDNPDATGHRGIGEVQAESVALMVLAAYGMDSSAYTVPYVAGWASAVPEVSPVEVVRTTGESVRRVALDILAGLPATPGGDGLPPGLVERIGQRDADQAAGRTSATRPPTTRAGSGHGAGVGR